MNAEESRKRYVDVMGNELGVLFTALDEELTWVFLRWAQFRKLFVDSPTNIDVLNRTASFFFWLIQNVLFEETILGISRLAGPVKSAGKPNLALRRLVPCISDSALQVAVVECLADVDSAAVFAKDWRNRHIAHRDLELSLGKAAAPLAAAEISSIDRALDRMATTLNCVTRHFFRSETAYRLSAPIQDAEDLVYYLKAGIRREDIRRRQLEAGEYHPDAWNDDIR